MKQGGGLGNELNGLLHAFLAALVTNRSLIVNTVGSHIAGYLKMPAMLGGWGAQESDAKQHLNDMANYIQDCSRWTTHVNGKSHLPKACTVWNVRILTPSFTPMDIFYRNMAAAFLAAHGAAGLPYEALLGCASRRLLQPGIAVVHSMRPYVAAGEQAIGVHLRGSDKFMAQAAGLQTSGPDSSRVPVFRRRLAFNFNSRTQGLSTEGARFCVEDTQHITSCLRKLLAFQHERQRSSAIFLASDSSDTIRSIENHWRRSSIGSSAPPLVHTAGAPIHTAYQTGRGVNASAGWIKALADFFLLTRTATFVPNCVLTSSTCTEGAGATLPEHNRGACLPGHSSSYAFHVRLYRLELHAPSIELPSLCATQPMSDYWGV